MNGLALLCAAVLAAAGGSSEASGSVQSPLVMRGPSIQVTVAGRQAGMISELAARDWAGDHQVAAGPLGDVVVRLNGQQFRLSLGGAAACRSAQLGRGKWQVNVDPVRLAADDGTGTAISVEQSYTFYREGAVFCDLTLKADPASRAKLERCSLEFPWAVEGLKPLRFYVKPRGIKLGMSEYIGPQVSGRMDRYPVTHAGFMFGHGKGFCAAVECVLENQRRAAGSGHPSFVLSPLVHGRKTFAWILYDGPPVELGKTALARQGGFKIRWGVCTSAMPQRSIAIGQRVAHWQEGQAALMSFPSDSAIEAMALAGVSVNVLHLYWSRRWREFVPVDEKEMRRWVRSCKAHGIRPVLYVIPAAGEGVRGINEEWYRGYGIGGLYFDFGAVGYNTAHFKADYPAMEYLELARRCRQVVGADGLMISHGSGQFPDLVFFRHIDAYLPGEVVGHAHMMDNWELASWYSGQAVAVSHPWCEYRERWQTRRAAATFAAIGAFPHVLFGRGTHQDNNYHRCVIFPANFVLPYWQMLRAFPMDRSTTMYNEATERVARTVAEGKGADVHWVIYSRGREGVMAIVSNLGKAADVRLEIDARALGLGGRGAYYRGWLIPDDVLSPPRSLRWSGGAISIGRLGPDRYCAVVLARPDSQLAEFVRGRLAQVAELRRQLTCKTPPGPVRALRARTSLGLVELSWLPPTKSQAHVCEYRVRRSDNPKPLPPAEECTFLRDFTAPPGERVRYFVAAADIAGNVGPAETVDVLVPRGDVFCYAFDQRPGDLKTIAGVAAVKDGWLQLGAPWPVASRKGDTFSFAPSEARYVRIYFSGGRFNYENAHVIEAAVFGDDGKKLQVVGVKSSGDDPGHPASDVIDGITDQSRNGWWSDRRKGIPAWVMLDLGQPRKVAKVWVLTYADGRRWYDYRVELSSDGRRWRAVGYSERPRTFSLCLGPELDPSRPAVISVVVRPVEDYRVPGGLVFGADDKGNGFALVLDDTFDGYLRLVRLEGQKYSVIAGQPFGYSVYRPLPHLIAVRWDGQRAECWCDGRHVFDADLPQPPGRRVGLVARGGRLMLDNLQAWSASGGRKAGGK